MTKVSIVVPAFNQSQHTINVLAGITKTYGVDFETILIDDGSTEAAYKILHKLYSGVKILRNEVNLGFIKSVNRGIKEATGNWILLLNNDVDVSKDAQWLKKLVDGAIKSKLDLAGVAGCRATKEYKYIPGEMKKESDKFDYLAGWCIIIRREVIEKIGGLDEDFGAGYFDDFDFCVRAKKAGFKLGIVEGINITHLYHQTFKSLGVDLAGRVEKNRQIFIEKRKNEK